MTFTRMAVPVTALALAVGLSVSVALSRPAHAGWACQNLGICSEVVNAGQSMAVEYTLQWLDPDDWVKAPGEELRPVTSGSVPPGQRLGGEQDVDGFRSPPTCRTYRNGALLPADTWFKIIDGQTAVVAVLC